MIRARVLGGRISGLVVMLASLATAPSAGAQSTIRTPGAHGTYDGELELHGVLAPFDPPGGPSAMGPGVGLRLSFPIVSRGFVTSIDDSVAIGIGADLISYAWRDNAADPHRPCAAFAPAPNGTSVCIDAGRGARDPFVVFVPAVLQWSFWLTERWSVFAEPGIAPYYRAEEGAPRRFGVVPIFLAGARYRFSRNATLVLRAGYPTVTVGISFLL